MTSDNLPKSRNEFLKSYSAGERDFSGINLRGANLAEQNLVGVILRAANLQDTDLSKANLSGANFSGIPRKLNIEDAIEFNAPNRVGQDFKESDFESEDDWLTCGLSGTNAANLQKAKLNETNLCGADLRKADLRGADLTNANLERAKLTGADLSPLNGNYDSKGTALRGTNLKGAVLRKLKGWGIDLRGSQIDATTQLDNDLSLVDQIVNKGRGENGNFIGQNLVRVNLEGANLSNADLTDAQLFSAFLRGANLRNADLSRAELKFADLRNSDLVGTNLRTATNLDRARLEGVKFDETTRFPSKFDIHSLLHTSNSETQTYSPIAINSYVPKLIWEKIDANNFERLIYNLIVIHENYENPKWLIKTNAADKSRDLSADKIYSDPLSGVTRKRVIIQCKRWLSDSISPSDVIDVKEKIKLWEPPRIDILIIATTGRFTCDAVAYVEKHNQSDTSLTIDLWADSDLERILASHPQLIAEFGLR